jgi:spore germination protein GerM
VRALRFALVVAVLTASCGFPAQDSPTPIEGGQPVDTALSDPSGGATGNDSITTWFVDESVIVPLTRRVASPATVSSAVATVAAGVSQTEGSRGLRSAIPDPAMVKGATLSRGTATVDLASEFLDIPARDQVLALGQLVLTLTDLRGVGRVRFEINGEFVAVPLPSGESTDDSVSRDDFIELSLLG